MAGPQRDISLKEFLAWGFVAVAITCLVIINLATS